MASQANRLRYKVGQGRAASGATMATKTTIPLAKQMMFRSINPVCAVAALVLCCLTPTQEILSQTTQNKKPAGEDDVVRVRTDLVQTDVMVFDKQGRFVSGLNLADFELRIDGKSQPVQFFERITAGSADEEVQLSAARGRPAATKGKEPPNTVPLDRGRTVFFYVDDLHLSARDIVPTRKVLLRFIEKDMGQNDAAAITSVTGQIGFLQQLTDNKAVLRAAVGRLNARPYVVTDGDRPPMTEYQALKVERYDRELVDFYVEQIIREFPGTTRQSAESQVHGRAHTILAQAANIATRTLATLESLVKTYSKLSGRKLLFFISAGFFVDEQNSDSSERLRRITSAAARSGVVIYSMDARGLVASLSDASSPVAFDPSGRVERSSSGELIASQDAMNALARDTGGRPIFNTNALDVGLSKALKETSVYYLLAWRPEQPAQARPKFRRIAVTIPSHPELTVRVRQGFFDVEPAANVSRTKVKEQAKPANPPQAVLGEALNAVYPNVELPVALTLNYMNQAEKGPLLTSSLQIQTESLVSVTEAGTEKAILDIIGAIYNDQGKVGAHFADRLAVPATSIEKMRQLGQDIIYSYPVFLPPGLYQMRVAVRDASSGKIGTANEWIEIPNLASRQLTLSSLIAGERAPQANANASGSNTGNAPSPSEPELAPLRIDRRFHRNSFLRFLVYVYNAARAVSDSKPDVAVQIQILRDQQPVLATPLKKLSTEGVLQLDQLPYAADVSLEGLAAGRYVLHVTTIDRVSKTSASQAMRFEIE